ncbi:RNA polymerase sigma factor [Hydrogenophaga sp.]|uniref:RNA polymerase sigma factor n=1 Tax=Hydrogenophaga sp. TaxID=1904254 RepID=UPI003F72A72F
MHASSRQDESDLRADLDAIIEQDAQAMKRFYLALAPTTYQFAMRRLSDPVQAEEVVVETMYEVWTHAGRFSGQSSIRTWVLGIARHKLLDKLRDRYRHQHEALDDETEDARAGDAESHAPEGFERVAQREHHDMIVHCAGKLPEDQREALHLALYEDLPLADIARVQACPENTVKTRLFHARRKMKECLQRLFKDVNGPFAGAGHG